MFLCLLLLSAFFYVGVFFNAKIIFNITIPLAINLLISLTLLVLIVIQIILYNVRFGKYKFLFYTNRIEFEAKKTHTFYFNDYKDLKVKQNIFDKMFNTGTLILTKKFRIGPVKNSIQMKDYLLRLIKYYQYQQQRYKIQEAQQRK